MRRTGGTELSRDEDSAEECREPTCDVGVDCTRSVWSVFPTRPALTADFGAVRPARPCKASPALNLISLIGDRLASTAESGARSEAILVLSTSSFLLER